MNIQCVTHGLVTCKDKILVYKVIDSFDNKSFYRLIGGHIEFGEPASSALKREFKEEVGQDIEIVSHLESFENIFFYKGKTKHEFLSLFKVEFIDKSIYDKDKIVGIEGPDRTFVAKWIPLIEFTENRKYLYPPKVLDYL